MNLLRIARVPPVSIGPEASVKEAVEKMTAASTGAIAVVDKGKLVGMFTERDLMNRVVREDRPIAQTKMREVMSADPHVAPLEMDVTDAFEFMTKKHFRHLPVVDDQGHLKGMLSMRHLMRRIAEHLSHELESLNAYITADGPGG